MILQKGNYRRYLWYFRTRKISWLFVWVAVSFFKRLQKRKILVKIDYSQVYTFEHIKFLSRSFKKLLTFLEKYLTYDFFLKSFKRFRSIRSIDDFAIVWDENKIAERWYPPHVIDLAEKPRAGTDLRRKKIVERPKRDSRANDYVFHPNVLASSCTFRFSSSVSLFLLVLLFNRWLSSKLPP